MLLYATCTFFMFSERTLNVILWFLPAILEVLGNLVFLDDPGEYKETDVYLHVMDPSVILSALSQVHKDK